MSVDQMELVGRTDVHRGRYKLDAKDGKTIVFPAGTLLLSATGPHPRDARYGDHTSVLVVEHPDINPTMDGSEYPVLEPVVEVVDGRHTVIAWVKNAAPKA